MGSVLRDTSFREANSFMESERHNVEKNIDNIYLTKKRVAGKDVQNINRTIFEASEQLKSIDLESKTEEELDDLINHLDEFKISILHLIRAAKKTKFQPKHTGTSIFGTPMFESKFLTRSSTGKNIK